MIRLLKSGWSLALLGALMYGAMTAAFLSPSKVLPPIARSGSSSDEDRLKPSWAFFNPEVDRLIAELTKEKQSLATREKQLSELAARLEAERSEINIVTQAVHQMQREFDRSLLRVKEEEQANLRKLAKTYAAMSADSAANIFRQMEDDQVVRILTFMKDTETAPVLESFSKQGEAEAKRAALISERLRTVLYRNPATSK